MDAGPGALEPAFHCVSTPWIRGFMAFQPAGWRLGPTGSRSAGRLAAEDRAHATAGLGHGRVTGCRRLGGGEGPVRSAEPERVSQRLAVLADLGTGVHVEQAHAFEQVLRGARHQRRLYL